MKKTIIVGIWALLIAAVFGCAKFKHKEPEVIKRTRFLMDTYCTIQVPGKAEEVDKIIDKAFNRMEEIDQKFNCLNPKSPLYQFNNNRIPIVDSELIQLIKVACKISEETDGAFDITVEPLVNLWGFYTENPSLPAKDDIQKCLKKIGYKHLVLKDKKVTSDNTRVMIDLGGIAKGYSIQEAVKILKNHGIKSALIEAGGQVHAFGKLGDKLWKIGVCNPRSEGIIAGLAVTDETGISTSGDYERFFEKDGVRYCHILDPQTGYPSRGTMSISVITDDPILADTWSTALFVMGPEKAVQLTKNKPEMDIILINSSGKIYHSAGLIDKLMKTKNEE